MKKITAKAETTLFSLLAGSGYSKTKVKQLVRYRAISVGDKPVARYDHGLMPGDQICIQSEEEKSETMHCCPGIEIVYEDEAIVVINKPAGLLTIATQKEKIKTAYYKLTAYLKEKVISPPERLFIVHRLDRDSSGLLVFAKKEIVKRFLQENWKSTEKKYVAVVEGIPREKSGHVAGNLRESQSVRGYAENGGNDNSTNSVTNYEVVKTGGDYALLDITLEIGGKNQIRGHMAEIGHPVAGDKKYGAKTDPLGRLALHANYLSFKHPVTGKNMEFHADMPKKFKWGF